MHIAAGRFSDTLLTFLDWIKQTGPPSIDMATGMDCSSPFVAIQPGGWDDFSPTPHETKKSMLSSAASACAA